MADFGLARIMEVDESNGPGVGVSIRWMAPEIIDPDRYGYTKRFQRKLPSKSADIYALGMTILEARTS